METSSPVPLFLVLAAVSSTCVVCGCCRSDIELDINPLPKFMTSLPGIKQLTTYTVRLGFSPYAMHMFHAPSHPYRVSSPTEGSLSCWIASCRLLPPPTTKTTRCCDSGATGRWVWRMCPSRRGSTSP